MQLTPEQQKLVEDNHNLIYSFLNSHRLSIDDYYDVAAIGLCKAAYHFDPAKGIAFSTYAYKLIQNEILREMRKNNNISHGGNVPDVSLQEPTTQDDDTLTLGDMIPANYGNPEDALAVDSIHNAIDKLDPKHREIMKLFISGYKQGEIANIVGTSQANVSRIICKCRKDIA